MAQMQSLSKALDILIVLGKAGKHLSVEQLSLMLEIPESSVYRLLQTLEAKGFVERVARGSIGLGSTMLGLSRNIYERYSRELCVAAAPLLQKIANSTGETALLSVRTDLNSKCLKSAAGKHIIRFVAEEDRLSPLHTDAAGLALLAFESERVVDSVMESLATAEERELLGWELEEIREKGHAVLAGGTEQNQNAVGLAVPVYNTFGKVAASLAIAGPDTRLKEQDFGRCIELLKEMGTQLTASGI